MRDPHTLIDAYLDGDLDEAGFAALSDWLRADAANRRVFALAMADHSGIADWSRDGSGAVLLPELESDNEDWIETLAALDAHSDEAQPIDLTEELARREIDAKESQRRARRIAERDRLRTQSGKHHPPVIPTPLAWLASAAMAGIVATIAVYFGQSNPGQTTPQPAPIVQTPQPDADITPVAARAAVVRSTIDARWVGHNDPQGLLREGQEVTLAEGLAEVVFDDGTAVIVQGPATFEATGTHGMRLVNGKITASAHDAAHGFTVDTPSGLITNYGTEFGVIANHDGQVLAQAFTGRIGLTPIGGADEVALAMGDAAIADLRGEVHRVEPDALAFVREEEFSARRDTATQAYARWLAYSYELRRDPAVLAYFVPERAAFDRSQLPNLGTGSATSATLDGTALVAGRFGEKQALGFASDNDICAFSDDTATDDLTLAAWVWIDRLRSKHVMLMGTEFWETLGATHWQLELSEDHRTWGMSIGMLERVGGEGPKTTSWGILLPTDAGRWVHLAVVVDGAAGSARFYVDGVLRDAQAYQSAAPHVLGNARIGTLRSEGRVTPHGDRHFDGRIDEMVILSRPMSDGEIQQMYDAGRPPAARPAGR